MPERTVVSWGKNRIHMTEWDKIARLLEEFGDEWAADEVAESSPEAQETPSVPAYTGTHPAVFFDRDGTLNEEVHYLHRIEDFKWIEGAPDAIKWLNEYGYRVVVVTNQAGIGHGYYTAAEVETLHHFMQAELSKTGAHIDAFYFSPWHPEAKVAAFRADHPDRKPGTGMFEQAIRALELDPRQCFVIGDRNSDIEAGRKLGMMTFLVLTGYGNQEKRETLAHFIVENAAEAVSHIEMLHTRKLKGFDTDLWDEA